MPHPFLPDPIPKVPEHVVPTGPSEFEVRLGVLYCVRCGRGMLSLASGEDLPGRSRPCRLVRVGPRGGPG